ncbi:MAG: histidine--tRNA ligase [Candidatus Pacebacteria bacterium]|nr:histidine--tRNA ligase [Candidatus Paceibacterota bacterium]
MENKKISTEAYKGTRDFYPEDLAVQNFIFDKMRKTAESFGYEEYGASILESSDLYKAKSGEEIVNEQTYTFEDKGGREVTLRPEMTPTLARMVAKRKRELNFPLRWFSIQNFFRYERPQKGRLREFWQLNADIFGVKGIEAEVEIISLGYEIMKSLGAKDKDFVIKINYTGILARLICKTIKEDDKDKIIATIKIIDRFGKIPEEDFNNRLNKILGEEKAEILKEKLNNGEMEVLAKQDKCFDEYRELKDKLSLKNINNIKFDSNLTRGFDYYTGIIFEFFDTNPENNRSLFGGGRYDDLLDIFGEEKIPAVGFGMGDVTTKDFLESRGLLKEYQSKTQLYICTLDKEYLDYANKLAQDLRNEGLNIAVDYSDKKVGDQITKADKKSIPFVICIGEDEQKTNKFKLKNLKTGEEIESLKEDLIENIT